MTMSGHTPTRPFTSVHVKGTQRAGYRGEMLGVAGTVENPPAAPDADLDHPKRVDLPKSPLIVMCLTFGMLALTLAIQVLFVPNDRGSMIDPTRPGGSIHADRRDDTGGMRPGSPHIAFNGAGWPDPLQDPGFIWETPPTE